MQLSSRPVLRATLLVVALISAVFAVGPALALTQSATIVDGGDGFPGSINAEEASLGTASMTWDVGDLSGATKVELALANDPDPAPAACQFASTDVTSTAPLAIPAACASALDDGDVTLTTTWKDASDTVVGIATASTVLDRQAPASLAFDDAFINKAESEALAAAGPELNYRFGDADVDTTPADIEIRNVAASAPLVCQYSGVPIAGADADDGFGGRVRNLSTLEVNSQTCLSSPLLSEGAIEALLSGVDDAGNENTAVATALLDRIPPTASIAFDLAGPAVIGTADAAAGVKLAWSVSETGPPVTVSISDSSVLTPDCVFASQPRVGDLIVGSACFNTQRDGTITALVEGLDDAGNPASAATTASLQIRLGEVAIEAILDDTDPNGDIRDIANASETANGLGVQLNLADIISPEVSAVVTVTDRQGNVASATKALQPSAGAIQTVFVPVSSLVDGAITTRAVLTDDLGNVSRAAPVSSRLDRTAPTTTWATPEGDVQVSVHCCVAFDINAFKVTLEGTVADAAEGSGVRYVYITGINLDTDKTFYLTAELSAPDAGQSDYSLATWLETGEWEVTAVAADNAYNIEVPDTSEEQRNTRHIQVIGTLD